MSIEQAPSIFQSFNARALTPSQVAKTFVPSDSFAQLAQRRHSMILGPRGSGKTTLLKMLQPAAIEAWEHPDADKYASNIEFTGVFVPFDRSWRAQIDALGGSRQANQGHSLLGTAAFTTHVYRALVSAFLSRISTQGAYREHRRVSMSPSQQADLSAQLYQAWKIPGGPKSLLGLRSSLGQRLAEIGSLGRKMMAAGESDTNDRFQHLDWVYSPFIDGVAAALDAWEATLEKAEERWALLFDELELAPADIKRILFESLRSRDSRLLFKLALSPFDSEVPLGSRPEDAQAGDDYDPIPLWFSEKRDTLPFCGELWNAMLKEKDIEPVSPRAAFGRSKFDSPQENWRNDEGKTAYGLGTRWQRMFSQLEEIDPTFRRYLAARGYKSEELELIPPDSRAAEIRKISPLVAARLFFLRDELRLTKRLSKRRSRKRLTLYTGWETLCAVSEGNPRWFIGLIKPLLDATGSKGLRVSQSLQAIAIASAAERYRAALRTIPVHSQVARKKTLGLLSILDSIGDYFRREQIDAPFAPEPPGSFIVDGDSSDELVEAVGQALNAGALVLVDKTEENRKVGELRHRRLRLCYLLVAHYGAIPRLEHAVSLKRILHETKFESRDQVQLQLA
jgi:energy-coupling factor transporter ATP-binding protein EcfA2